ncbi:MAG: TerB family tellurite resistance protein, partial [Crocinitomicaceae bacterium]|nr:TerB family tellurite resistance protein [Crocinitomicaceae bacterium]
MAFFVLFPLILYFFLLIFKYNGTDQGTIWLNGRIPSQFPFNKDNLMEVYLSLAVLMLKQERKDTKEKLTYIRSHIKRKFPNASMNLTESLGTALRDESIELKTAASWINKHLAMKGKIQIIQFLCDISFIDGKLHPDEEKILSYFSVLLKIPIEEVRSIVAGLEEAYERRNHYSKSKSTTSSNTSQVTKNIKRKRMA